MMDERHEMNVTSGPPYEGTNTEYITVFFPELGNMTITYETRPFASETGEKRPVISFDFAVSKVDVIDRSGSDREIR